MRVRVWVLLVLSAMLGARPAVAAPQSFVNFESGHVRPLAVAKGLLFAVNTPDNRLMVYIINGLPASGPAPSIRLKLAAEVSVGLDPVAVAAHNTVCLANGDCRFDAWVVNHLSDDLTAITLVFNAGKNTVKITGVDTIATCDEPRDIVLAGQVAPGQAPPRAFVTTARRGQHCPLDAHLHDPGVDRGLVQVFNVQTHAPVATLELFTDTPRGLAASRDGKRVYAAGFLSGNRTATVAESAVTQNGGLPPAPPFSTANPPRTGLIARFDPATGRWEENGVRPGETAPKDWSSFVPFVLPDFDVFAIDAAAATPSVERRIPAAGTVLFNLAVRPPSGAPATRRDQIFVTNTEALNAIRFETELKGHLADNRITVIDGDVPVPVPGAGAFNGWVFDVSPVQLNPTADIADSLALPTDLVFSTNGTRLYVAALGSGAVGIFDAEQLSQGDASGREVLHVGGGPSGLALDPVMDRLYVMDRFNNAIVVVRNAGTAPAVLGSVPLYDPSGAAVRNGRRVLYDAKTTSAHGDAACATCHVFGDFDALAWDLGDPFGQVRPDCNLSVLGSGQFHPMKGPMTTQTLRGMADAGPLHWRGDRSGCMAVPSQSPFDVAAAFKLFNGAFVGLLGRATELDTTPGGELDQFTDFALTMRYPPNPIRPFDDFSAAARAGRPFFDQIGTIGAAQCTLCHALPLGTNGRTSDDGEPQRFKVAQLRNLYQKVGMFGVASGQVFGFPLTGNTGKQVRGFGYLHDGSVDTVRTFLHANVFFFPTEDARRDLSQFLLEFDTGLAPVVGQQVTVTTLNGKTPSLLIARADAGDCDLVARGVPDPANAREKGFWYHPAGGAAAFEADAAPTTLTPAALAASLKPGGWLTYTCVPPGSGRRIGIDRDCDGVLDGDESTAAPDPIASYPQGACP